MFEAEAVDAHAEAAELDHDVGAGGEGFDGGGPAGEDRLVLAFEAADAERAADMVEHDGGAGEGASEVDQFGDLGMIQPGLEGHLHRRQAGEAFAEFDVTEQAGGGGVAGVVHRRVRIMGDDVADAAETVAAGVDMGFEDAIDGGAEAQVGVADDAGADAAGAVDAAGAHGGGAVDEFGFADGAEVLGAIGLVEGAGLDEDGGDDVVSARDIGEQVMRHVAPVRAVPQMVVRVDDRQGGVDDVLVEEIEPVLAHREIGAGRRWGAAHGIVLPWHSALMGRHSGA